MRVPSEADAGPTPSAPTVQAPGASPSPPLRLEAAALVVLYTALYVGWDLAGGHFRIYPDLWQLLPWPPLLNDLAGSLLDLHAQPPLLNLLFGLALRASVWTGWPVERLLEPIYFALGAGTVTATWAVAARVVPRRGVRVLLLLLMVLNPYFYAAHHYLFYTGWELLLLSLVALLGLRFLDEPGARRLAAALAPATVLVYARSLFHPLWLVGVVLAWIALGPGTRGGRGRLLAVAAAALAIAAAWPLKNLARFGFFGFSSWSGVSIARGLPTGEPLLASGYPRRLAAFARVSTDPVDPRAAAEAERLVPPRFAGRPALATIEKPDGSPNWNHYAIIPLSRGVGEAGMAGLRARPELLLYKAADFYLNGYAVYEARWPYTDAFSPELAVGAAWARAYELVVFQRFRAYEGDRTGLTTGFALVFPAVIGAAVLLLWRRRPWGAEQRVVVVLLGTILWVLAMVVFVDGPEGNRVRFCTEPYLLLVAGWVVATALGPRRAA